MSKTRKQLSKREVLKLYEEILTREYNDTETIENRHAQSIELYNAIRILTAYHLIDDSIFTDLYKLDDKIFIEYTGV